MLENSQGQPQLDLAIAQSNERVKNRILYILPSEEERKKHLLFSGDISNAHKPKIITVTTVTTKDKDYVVENHCASISHNNLTHYEN